VTETKRIYMLIRVLVRKHTLSADANLLRLLDLAAERGRLGRIGPVEPGGA